MGDASVVAVDGRAVVTVGGAEMLLPYLGQATIARDQAVSAAGTATSKATEASQYAAAAAAFANRYATYAAGNAATPTGQDFSVVDAAGGWINIYRKGTSTETTPLIQLPGKAAYAGPSGAQLIGYQYAPASLKTVVQQKLRYRVTMGVDYPLTSAGFTQASIDAQIIEVPKLDSLVELSDPVVLKPATKIIGHGVDCTSLTSLAETAFICETPNGGDVWQGPCFEDIRINCAGSGIRINRSNGGFSDASDTQCSVFGSSLLRVNLRGPGTGAGNFKGVEWNKAYQPTINQCEIRGFRTGVKSLGSDFALVHGRTRVWACGTLFDIEKVTTVVGDGSYNYGSSFHIVGCDLLIPTISFIRSNDFDLMVAFNYMETGAAVTGPALDLYGTNAQHIVSNRIELPATFVPTFLRQVGDLSLFVFQNNNTNGEAWGAVDWADASYWKSVLARQRLMISGNRNMAAIPFQTVDPETPSSYRDAWVLTPGTKGLLANNYGLNVRVKAGAFVIPPIADFASQINFKNVDEPVSGAVNIRVLAKSTVAGQELVCARRNGTSTEGFATIPLSTQYVWYTPFANVTVADLEVLLANIDTGRGGNALVSKVIVERV